MVQEQAYPHEREMRVKHFVQNHQAAATQDVKFGSSHFN